MPIGLKAQDGIIREQKSKEKKGSTKKARNE
jgi:hypothetical protein